MGVHNINFGEEYEIYLVQIYTLFTVFVSLFLDNVVSAHFNASVLTNPLYYLWYTFSEPRGKSKYCKIKGPHPAKS